MTREISKDTSLCISLSARPSNIGTRFHNYLYEALDLDFVYKAFAPTSIEKAVAGIRGLGIRGAAVSMPFKEVVIELLDSLDDSARGIGSVNTILNTEGHLRGFNTDFIAVQTLLAQSKISPRSRVCVIGSGGMAKAVVAALASLGFTDVIVAARNELTGRALASNYQFEYLPKPATADVFINATPVGMAGGPLSENLVIDVDLLSNASLVMDVVAVPPETPLIRTAEAAGVRVILGTEVMILQAVEQFVLYTGIRPNEQVISLAADYARN
jgi:shikimate dehydrogenase